jgi:hypothetical protein
MVGMKNQTRFEEAWPELADTVRRSLGRRRVPAFIADDIVQETGLRLFKMWDEVDETRSPRGLALTIAGNLLWDETNRRAKHEVVGDVPENACDDVERAGIARLELARVQRAMRKLNPHHRSVLLAEIGDDELPFGSTASIKMMRMRARRRLTALLESASAGAFFPFLKRGIPKVARVGRRMTAVAEVPALALVMCTAAVMVLVPTFIPASSSPSMTLDADGTSGTSSAARTMGVYDPRPSSAHSATVRHRVGSTVSESTDNTGHHYRMAMPGGMPVQGGASIDLVPRHGHRPTVGVPSCDVSRPSDDQIVVSCREEVNGQELSAGAVLRVSP